MRRLGAVALAVLFLGCARASEEPSTPDTIAGEPAARPSTPDAIPGALAEAGLEAEVRGSRLVLTNTDTAAAYYTVFEQGLAALVNWRPCVDPGECASVPGRGTREVPVDSIMGYRKDAREMIVYWWRLRPTSEGRLAPDSVRSRIVPF